MNVIVPDRLKLVVTVLLFLAACSGTPTTPQAPLAETRHGPVTGLMDGDISVFKGIRYGADTATTRFAPPAQPSAWSAPVAAGSYGPSCPQRARASISLFTSWASEPDPGMSEDCLFLNVWTPGTDSKRRPVMVWLHGGGFSTGSGSSNAYNGTRLAQRGDVVVVTVNHRLNALGYLYLDPHDESFSGSGTAGMLDLVMALEWVRDNISGFGGDPDNVLIFGESGGGWKVTTLMAMDSAAGLFHRAVAQSGPALTVADAVPAAEVSAALLDELGIPLDNVGAIRRVPYADIQSAMARLAESGVPVANRPVIDGVAIERHPFTPSAPGQSADVPLLIGSTRSEMSLLIGARQPSLFNLTWDTLPGALERVIPGLDAEAVIKGYRKLHPEITPPNLFFEATTDNSIFGRGSFTLADRKAAQGGAPVYQYYLNWGSPVEGGKWEATHALDIGFVFDNVARSASMSGTGPEQQALADVMSEAWLAFARSGDPNHAGLPTWPEYTSETRATMVFDTRSRVVNDPRGQERALLDSALGSANRVED